MSLGSQGMMLFAFIIVGFGVVIYVAAPSKEEREAQERLNNASQEMSRAKPGYTNYSPETQISIRNLNWSKGGFNTVMLANFTIQNGNDYAVKDLRIIVVPGFQTRQ